MNNLKRKISLILSVIMLALVIFPVMISTASTNSDYVSMTVKLEGVSMKHGAEYTVKGGEKIKVDASSKNADIAFIAYYFDDINDSNSQREENYKNRKKVSSSSLTITVPTASIGTTKVLWVEAVDASDDGSENVVTKTGWQGYYLNYKEEEKVNGSVNAKYDGKTLSTSSNSPTKVDASKTLTLSATPVDRLTKIYFKWDQGQLMEVTVSPYYLQIPSNFKPGSTHRLDLIALYDNGEKSDAKVFYITIPEETVVEPDIKENPEDDELDILPWEKANNELDSLAISLRNDSESEKANKNIYALEEEVTYYIDFVNGGKDIKDEVKIQLELPLEFEVIDSANGIVDEDDGTITWTYPNGMEKEYEGTKTVVVTYTALKNKRSDSETIYPLASIYKANKLVDDSAVINYIYRDEDTVITDTHTPYMYGDANATTFRPDDTITRAEGALVLTRILLGQSAIDNVKVTSVYPDLDQTYLEAQKAIIAATTYGIINGYTDGYYRPNQEMTRAEFMKILATYIELNAEDAGIDGLQIKDLDTTVKIYKDPVIRYMVNGTTVTTHWAIEEVSLLARLNMTSVSSNDKNLRLDEKISRAEVAQLVNFFLLRAPAEVNNRTTTQFTDVNRKHKLFADIVEATREAHDYTLTLDGTEVAE